MGFSLYNTTSNIASTVNEQAETVKNGVPTLILVFFAIVGVVFLERKVRSYLRLLVSLFILPGKRLHTYGKKGSWALVTGASDGIGKEYALQLAAQGFNILLVSRTQSKLDELAKELESKNQHFKTKTLTHAMDFSANREEDYDKLDELVRSLDIAILVNNVGMSHSIPVPFAITDIDEIKGIIDINCLATLRVTQLVLPGMVQRRKGLVLTMGSFGGLLPTPLLATYSGSKAFLQQWSTALAGELVGSGIDVEFVVSYLVTSKLSKIRKPTLTIPTPKNFVRAVLDKIGRRGGSTQFAYSSTPYWAHGIMQWWLENTVGIGGRFVVNQNRNFHQSIRQRALKKAARNAKKE